MTQAGGPAAINGFLYQILQHIGWMAEARLGASHQGEPQDDDWIIVLEPRSGGDAQLEGKRFVVEQYKVSAGTWSFAKIIDVLLGLRKAVPNAIPERAAYYLVTSGTPGRGVANLLQYCRRIKYAADARDLDDKELHSYIDFESTDAELFRRICEETRSSNSTEGPSEIVEVLHLLQRFEVKWDYSKEAILEKVEAQLEKLFSGKYNAKQARRLLQALLQDRLAEGEMRLGAQDIEKLFIELNLDPAMPQKLARLAETMAAISEERVAAAGYIRSHDVRLAPIWPEDRPILVFAGESGYGKSWQLARLITDIANDREVVTWSSANLTAANHIERVTDDIWAAGLQQVDRRTMKALENNYRHWTGSTDRWLTVGVDNVDDVTMAKQLVEAHFWQSQGARLAMSASSTVASALRSHFPNRVYVVDVKDFARQELETFLSGHERSWSELPSDLKQLLKRPILAGLFVQLPYASVQKVPRSEYEVFDLFWQRMHDRSAPGDSGVLLALAASVLSREDYPVPRAKWALLGMDDRAATRLIASGWLKIDVHGGVSFGHDRLLNWAVARELVRRIEARVLSVQEVAEFIVKFLYGPMAFSRPLGYVPMDFFWMLTSSEVPAFPIDPLLIALEEHHSIAGDLYSELIPTLGRAAIKLLLRRLYAQGQEWNYNTIKIKEGLLALAKQDEVPLQATIQELLASALIPAQRVGLKLSVARPSAGHLNQLWSMRDWHDWRRKDQGRNPTDAQLWCDAARACVAANPNWFVETVHSPGTLDEELIDLSYILSGLESTGALKVWEQCKSIFVARTPYDRSRGVVYCARRFCDASMLDYVKQRLNDETDFLDWAAYSALTHLSPSYAIENMRGTRERFRSSNWMPVLFDKEPTATRIRIRELIKQDEHVSREIAYLFQSCGDTMGTDLFGDFLDALEGDLHQATSGDGSNSDDKYFHQLHFLRQTADAHLLAALRQRRGTSLEQGLVSLAKRRIATTSRSQDDLLEGARIALLHIAGEGIRELILAELSSTEYWGRHSGLMWGAAAGAPAASLLKDIASRWAPGTDRQSDQHMETYLAIKSLASLGADTELVSAIERVDSDCLSVDLAELRGNTPIDRSVLNSALGVLQGEETDEAKLRPAFVVVWLSGDSDLSIALEARLDELTFPSPLAAVAYHALISRQSSSSPVVRFAMRALEHDESRWMGVNLLIRAGKTGLPILRKQLESRPRDHRDYLDFAIIQALHLDDDHREFATNEAIDSLSRPSLFNEAMFAIAAAVNAPQVHEQIIEAAFNSRARNAALNAVIGIDAGKALEAARLELMAKDDSADSICRSALKMGTPDEMAIWFVETAKLLPKERRGAIGRVLRKLPHSRVSEVLEPFLNSDDRAEQLFALMLARWTSSPADERLDSIVHSAPDSSVREAAGRALLNRSRLRNALKLIQAFPTQIDSVKWSLLYALVTTTHKGLLTDRNDELWLAHILDDAPARFTHLAEHLLRNRRGKEPMDEQD